ncbi:hypothetical protein PROPHIGD91-2_37 [Mycobacterium phage prophiGD91-2]|nr:hypothetical protein PROPHIGD91-2_37 [Mycobacterium phage prophiGD91-2]SIJ02138.1 Uncharacterised protein [Mycobacteroides abscessus subsp. bolletii]SLD37324.1 Uncharacterised protein [Mycobacteroides abscessus subsp. bolletii]
MTQAITDIKELVGEMPARGCECSCQTCHRSGGCDQDAQVAVHIHDHEHNQHNVLLCARCLRGSEQWALIAIALGCGYCVCGKKLAQISDMLGPVIPL